MQLEWYEHYADGCFRDTPPPCSSSCPLGLDVRRFADRASGGKWNSAYRIYREHVLFPVIVSTVCHAPCRGSCVRGRIDHSVDLKMIEQACADKATGKPRKFKLLNKPQHIAVVGAGMDGLSCALRLASHGYPVTVFDMNELPGGSVLGMMDSDICRADIEMSFSVYDDVTFRLGTRISTIDMLEGYDAVYLALAGGWLDGIDITDRQGLFVTSAESCDVPVTERMACGLNAADNIEFWFQLGDKAEYTRLYGSSEPDGRYYRIHYEDRTADSADGAEAEASRCYQCNCGECYKVCPVMQREKQYPQRMTAYVIGTLWPNATRRPGVKMLTGCTMCGKCADVCPENIDMGECFREARKDFYASGHFAPAYHDYWMQELEFIQSDRAYLLHRGSGEGRASAVFFPGCQLGAADPELVIRGYDFLEKTCDAPALLLSCCGVTAEWAGDDSTRTEITDRIREEWRSLGEPVFITGCSTCRANLARYLPEIRTISLYRWMADHAGSIGAKTCGGKTVIYDPCGADDDDDTRAAVRELAELSGMTVVEADDGALPVCCGFGGHIYPANPDLYDSMVPELPEGADLTVYCASCRDAFTKKGVKARHILERLLGTGDDERGTADPAGRRENRKKLRAYYTGEKIVEKERRYMLDIPEEVKTKLDRLLILEPQVYEALEHAEDTKEKFFDRGCGLYYASMRFRNMTVWICYRDAGDGRYILDDVYRHRVEIKE